MIADDAGLWRAAAGKGATLGGYRFEGYKSEAPKTRAARVIVHGEAEPDPAEITAISAAADAVALVKDLVSIPAEWLGPADFAERAVASVKGLPVTVDVLDENALSDGGYGGILGVGQGSDRPPRLVRLDYAPEGTSRHVALVGKGITFDTGGLSLKPANSMVGMKYDMCGAATALSVLRAVAALQLPVRVTAWLCIADNMPSGRATRPGDVLRMLDGTTVEVLNTDAEGRLVLADGLAAASREHPDVIVDLRIDSDGAAHAAIPFQTETLQLAIADLRFEPDGKLSGEPKLTELAQLGKRPTAAAAGYVVAATGAMRRDWVVLFENGSVSYTARAAKARRLPSTPAMPLQLVALDAGTYLLTIDSKGTPNFTLLD